jgi:hypothetical protein
MSFLGKAINKAQHTDINHPFGAALNEYIFRHGQVAWDNERALFWVNHPQEGWQVAVWMMPVAAKFEPEIAA